MTKQTNAKHNDDLFSKLSGQSTERAFSDEELRSMTREFRNYIAAKNSDALRKPDGIEDFLRGKTITTADKNAAFRISMEPQVRQTNYYRPETFLATQGGRCHYTPEKVTLYSTSLKKDERANAAIPAPFGKPEKHSNVQALTAVAAQLVTTKDGKWVNNVPSHVVSKIFPAGENMDVLGMSELADAFTLILNDSRTWKVMDRPTKNSITGLDALVFIRQELDSLPDDIYFLINTRVVYLLIKPFDRDQSDWYERVDDQNKEIVPHTAYQEAKCTKRCLQQVKAEGYPVPYLYLGGYAPNPHIPSNTGRFKETKDRYDKMMEFQVGNSSCTAILSGMRGFSGLTDDFGKKIQFQVSATLAAWQRSYPVDIQLETVGDVVMLKSSLDHWVNYIKEKALSAVFPTAGDFKLIVPAAKDYNNVPPKLRSICSFSPRADCALVVYDPRSLPTSSEKNVAVDYDSCALDLIPSIWRNVQLIAYLPIYSDVFWLGDVTADDDITAKAKKSRLPRNIYQFGTAASWRGIISTFKGLNLWGYGYETGPNGKYVTNVPEKLVKIPLPGFESCSEWFKQVARDCHIQIVSWLRPISRYSPISNLPFMSKKGVELVLSTVPMEDGQLNKNFAFVEPNRGHRGKKIGPSVDPIPEPKAVEVKEEDVVDLRLKKPRGKKVGSSSSNYSDNRSSSSPVNLVDDDPDQQDDGDGDDQNDGNIVTESNEGDEGTDSEDDDYASDLGDDQ